MTQVLNVKNLSIAFGGAKPAVDNVSFSVNAGETVALVGESGSGKSVTALSTVKLLPDSANIDGSITYRGTQMVGADDTTLRAVRGNDISFIFQEPMTSLNPLHTIEKQLTEGLSLHQSVTDQTQLQRLSQWFASKRITNVLAWKHVAYFLCAWILYAAVYYGTGRLGELDTFTIFEDPQTTAIAILYALSGLANIIWALFYVVLLGVSLVGALGLAALPLQWGATRVLHKRGAENPYRRTCIELLHKVGIREAT